MNEFIALVVSAFDPNSPQHDHAQSGLISLRNNQCSFFLKSICQNLINFSEDEKIICLLLILSRSAFNIDDAQTSNNFSFTLSKDILDCYESLLLQGMNNENTSIRYHSSISFGHYSVFQLIHDSNSLYYFLKFLPFLNNNSVIINSIEICINYILKQISISNEQKKHVFQIIFPRLKSSTSNIESNISSNIESNISSNIESNMSLNAESNVESNFREKKICLQILRKIIKTADKFLTKNEFMEIISILIDFSTNPDLVYFCFSIFAHLANKNPNLLNDLFILIDISLNIIQNINNYPENVKFVIFRFWIYINYSECSIKSRIVENLPKIIEIALSYYQIPNLEDESDNYSIDHINGLLSSLICHYPEITFHILIPFVELNIKSENLTLQYASLAIFLLLIQNEMTASIIKDQAILFAEFGLSSPLHQNKILGLNILSYMSQSGMLNEPIKYINVCIEYLKCGIPYLSDEAEKTINSIASYSLCSNEDECEEESMVISNIEYLKKLIVDMFSLIPQANNSYQISQIIRLIADLIENIADDISYLNIIIPNTFQLADFLVSKPNDQSVGSLCYLFDVILSNYKNFPINFSSVLFSMLINLLNTENAEESLRTIGALARSLGANFTQFSKSIFPIIFQNFEANLIINESLNTFYKIIISCNSPLAVHEMIPRIFNFVDQNNYSLINFYVVILNIFNASILLYFDVTKEFLPQLCQFYILAMEKLNKINEECEDVSNTIALMIFHGFTYLIEKDIQHHLNFSDILKTPLINIIKTLLSSNDDLEPKTIALIINTCLNLSSMYGNQIIDEFTHSSIPAFLQSIAQNGNDNTKATINQIYFNIQHKK
ncbi:hypothetical protein TRFO_23044 [Tritrichomonas foetus]|uniref:Importin N-terminal domain-containing protein n=1 Tax=Tritrichomonas foetus TaxID=1144522 RepID=A0A1J4KBV3_9EUKA|nr:hypothetical protein TRFO_23044 [Tritrichomonas foetus]|eukprot:OHT08442.1 hypothetical protein TRFO_23044 [Tritrichomonas foetus]